VRGTLGNHGCRATDSVNQGKRVRSARSRKKEEGAPPDDDKDDPHVQGFRQKGCGGNETSYSMYGTATLIAAKGGPSL